MNKDFKWYWLDPSMDTNADIEMRSLRGKVNYSCFKDYLDLLKVLKGEKGNFGIIQEVMFKQNSPFFSPKWWNGKKDKYIPSIPMEKNSNPLDGLAFYETMIVEEGFENGILPSPVLFLTNIGEGSPAYKDVMEGIGKVKESWAGKHQMQDLNDAKVEYAHKWRTSYEDITEKLLEFEKGVV